MRVRARALGVLEFVTNSSMLLENVSRAEGDTSQSHGVVGAQVSEGEGKGGERKQFAGLMHEAHAFKFRVQTKWEKRGRLFHV